MSIDAQEGLLVAGRGCIFKDEVVLKGYPLFGCPSREEATDILTITGYMSPCEYREKKVQNVA